MKKIELYSEYRYNQASELDKRLICNGCGTDTWYGWLVPDTIYFLKITEACNIHDWEYEFGETLEDKKRADRTFLNNMIRIIDAKTKWEWLKKLRYKRAYKYYLAVKHFGAPAFWANKNKPENITEI